MIYIINLIVNADIRLTDTLQKRHIEFVQARSVNWAPTDNYFHYCYYYIKMVQK